MGRGPAASIGDADDFALGLGADEFEDATPRRRCILDSLSLEAGHASHEYVLYNMYIYIY